jgi:hypothetical protein
MRLLPKHGAVADMYRDSSKISPEDFGMEYHLDKLIIITKLVQIRFDMIRSDHVHHVHLSHHA